jgi:PTS system nitrogen regulatory IIA component
MALADIIKPDSVLCNAHARSKKHCLEILSELLARPLADIASEDIFERLIERERLGCTSMTRGVAFPHCRLEGLAAGHAALIKLSEPVEFDSPDGEPVDLVFGLLVPGTLTDADYADINMITNLLADEALCERLRAARSSKELHQTLLAGPGPRVSRLKAAEGG